MIVRRETRRTSRLGLILGVALGCLALAVPATRCVEAGDPWTWEWQIEQCAEEGPLEPVNRTFIQYDRAGDTCYHDQEWCCKTEAGTEATHYHLHTDVNGDLTPLEKERANRWFEHKWSAANPQTRVADASCYCNCHGYSLKCPTVWITEGPYGFLAFQSDDYTVKQTNWPGITEGVTVVKHTAHSSIVAQTSVHEDAYGVQWKSIDKVRQKCGFYGVYTTAPNAFAAEYGQVLYCLHPKPD
jgi:hypothetical protein